MSEPFSLSAFVADPKNRRRPTRQHLEAVLEALATSERPRSFRTLFWLLLRTLQKDSVLYASIAEHWMASETDVAQLLEDVGEKETRTVLSLDGVTGEYERLWRLSDDAGLSSLIKPLEPAQNRWMALALAPMAALVAERQLDELIAAVNRDRKWSDPAEVLSVADGEFDIEVLICLAQARIVEGGWGEPLNVAMLRLLSFADRQGGQ